jgi:hypothetical protein
MLNTILICLIIFVCIFALTIYIKDNKPKCECFNKESGQCSDGCCLNGILSDGKNISGNNPMKNCPNGEVCQFQRMWMDDTHISCQYDITNKNCNDSNFTADVSLTTYDYNNKNCYWSPECGNYQFNNNTKNIPCKIICGDKTITCPSSDSLTFSNGDIYPFGPHFGPPIDPPFHRPINHLDPIDPLNPPFHPPIHD